MSGVIVLVLRGLLAIALYLFLAWALYTIWVELRNTNQIVSKRQIPALNLTVFAVGEQQQFEFNTPEVLIGRDSSCEVFIPDDTVSSHHARLSYHHNQWWIEDLGSTNGTYLNDERVYTPTVIISGDEIRCGKVSVDTTIVS